MTPMILALVALAAAALPPPPAPAQSPTPAAQAAPVAAPDPAFAAINAKLDAMMADFKGKPLAGLARRLGPSESTRTASNGQVSYWRARTDGGTACGMNPATGAFSCNRAWGKECMLAVATDLNSNVSAWKLTGEVAACEIILAPAPAQP
jgi:hypothetical protein